MLRCGGSGGEVFGGVVSGFPVFGEEFFEAADGVGADVVEDVAGAGEGGKGGIRYFGQFGLDIAASYGKINRRWSAVALSGKRIGGEEENRGTP